MKDILNKCPVCGSKLEYHSLYQFSKVYKILKNGKLSARPQRNESACPMECGFIACSNADCDFHTNCDLEVEEGRKYRIYQTGDTYKIEINEDQKVQFYYWNWMPDALCNVRFA